MPTSNYQYLTPIVKEIIDTNPKTILDIGVGFGKWAFLAREFLEVQNGRVYPWQWTVKIDGIEIWEEYVKGIWWLKKVYNQVYIGDVCELIDKLGDYELIIAGDVIEHIEKEKALGLLKKLNEKAIKKFLLTIPLGNWLDNKIVADNPFERHRSTWDTKELCDLADRPIRTRMFKGVKGLLGVFIYEK